MKLMISTINNQLRLIEMIITNRINNKNNKVSKMKINNKTI